MELTDYIDGYCERLAPGLWAEPINAVTNLAFMIVAVIMWYRCFGMPLARALCAVLFAIGVGSLLFHTFATRWAAIADVTPILMFVLLYIFAVNRYVWNLTLWPALGLTALFFPFAFLTHPLWVQVPVLKVSAGYLPIPALIFIYAILIRWRAPETSNGLFIGWAILMASLLARSLDLRLCDDIPLGTHYIWHVLNAIMLGWMIEVYRRHRLHYAPRAPYETAVEES